MKKKTQENPKSWDAKAVISIIALIVSVSSLGWTIFNQIDQNKRWDSLNLGDVDLTDLHLLTWKTISDEEFRKTNWGYQVRVYPEMVNGSGTGKMLVPFNLILEKVGIKSRIENSNYFFTKDECLQEIERLGLNPSEICIMKNIQFNFTISNDGKTDVFIKSIDVSAQIKSGNKFESVPSLNYEMDLKPGKSVGGYFRFTIDFNTNLPEYSNFIIKAKYEKEKGKVLEKTFKACYNSSLNAIQPGNVDF